MASMIYVEVTPVNPTTRANSVHNSANAIGLSLSYDKGRGVRLSAYPAERRPDRSAIIIITAGEYAQVEPMARLNRKRLAILESAARDEIAARTGRAWELVLKLCDKRGYAVA